jgi:hypothetical protein
MDKESFIELQKIDCNCNDCKFMQRDVAKFKSYDHLHEGRKNARRFNYGKCLLTNEDVSFIPNQIMVENQECFEHRRK